MASNLKILVIRFSSLGDIVLTIPFLRKLRETNPEAVIDYLTKREYAQLLRYFKYVDNVIESADKINFRELRKLKKIIKNNYDIIYDLHNNLKTFYLKTFQKSKIRTFKKHSLRKHILVWLKINLMNKIPPVYNRYLRTGNFHDGFTTERLNNYETENIRSKLNIPPEKKIICIAPVSRHFTKTYPPRYYLNLIELFNPNRYVIVVTGAAEQKVTFENINKTNVIDLTGKTEIKDLIGLIGSSSLFISGDTGPMHIAELLGVPLIMMAGSSVKYFGFYPQTENSVVIENNTLKCRPCSHIGRNSCPRNHFRCMRDISPEMIYNQAMKMLEI